MQTEKYFGVFQNKTDIEKSFNVHLDNIDILFAEHIISKSSGLALVFFARDNQLFEVNVYYDGYFDNNFPPLLDRWHEKHTSMDDIINWSNNNKDNLKIHHKAIKDALTSWNMNTSLDFDFDTLPTAEELRTKYNFSKIIQNKTLLEDQTEQLKNIQNQITSEIKTALINEQEYIKMQIPLKFYEGVIPFLESKQEIIHSTLIDIFQATTDSLNNKNWTNSIHISPTNQFIIEIKIPLLTAQKDTLKTKIQKRSI
jgi:hypothetical protein